MTGGTEFSEAEVKPIKEEVEASPEKVAEVKEAAEVQRATDEATHTPEATIEKMEHAPAEDLQKAFVEAVPLAQAGEVSPASSTFGSPDEARGTQDQAWEGQSTDGETADGSGMGEGDGSGLVTGDPEVDSGGSGDSDSGSMMGDSEGESGGSGDSDSVESGSRASQEAPVAGAVQEVATEFSTAIPAITLEGAEEEGKITIERAAVEQSESGAPDQPKMQEEAPAKTPEITRAAAETASVPDIETVERNDGEMKFAKDGGEDDKFNPDDVYEQAQDLKEPNQVSGQYGSAGDPIKGSGDYMGDPAQGAIGIPDIPGNIPDLGNFTPGQGGGMEPGDLGGPGVGLDQEGELGGLAGAAAFGGGDSRVGWRGETEMTDSMDNKGKQKISYKEHYENDDGSTTDITTDHDDGVTTQTTTRTDKDGNTTTETDVQGGSGDGGGSDGGGGDGGGGDGGGGGGGGGSDGGGGGGFMEAVADFLGSTDEEAYDPEGASGLTPDDHVLPVGSSPINRGLDDEAVSQQVDGDSASPKEPRIAFDRATQTDPYSQDTVDGVDMPSTGYIPEEKSKFTPGMAGGDDGVLDPDFGAVDPNKPTGEPDTGGGGEGPPPENPRE